MVAKLCALWFVLVSVLPFTAPFSTMDTADFVGSHRAGIEIALTTQIYSSVADDTVMVSDRSDFFFQARRGAVVTTSGYDVVLGSPLVLPPIVSTTFIASVPQATSILRI